MGEILAVVMIVMAGQNQTMNAIQTAETVKQAIEQDRTPAEVKHGKP